MKYIATIFLFILLACETRQPNHKLPAFNLTFISGCNAITTSKINVYFRDDKYFADHTSPTYFNGQQIDSLWTVELNVEQINACIKFLDKAKSLPKKCDRFSSVENRYIIAIGKDTLDINGDCNWDNLDFSFLDKQLFAVNHLDIENKKNAFIADLNKKLIGKWYLQPLKEKLKRDDKITFSRNKISDCCWEFGDTNSLKGNCNKMLDIKDLKRFKTEISDRWNETVISIYWGKQIYQGKEQDYAIMYDKNATFTLGTISNDELKLNFLW